MATLNVGIKIAAAIAAAPSGSGNSGTITAYTCPANSYAVLNVRATCTVSSFGGSVTAVGTFRIGGIDIGQFIGVTGASSTATMELYQGIYVGPSQSVQWLWSGGALSGSGQIWVQGTQFVNTQ